ncbi:bacteriocin [Enterococcus cecorum]|uniref:bacteriocin n=1 Tax=Enterococcus cecorum TaxID=44008 RepID=UPI001693BFE2|nr:bacteriocin [Enterococcus cecorum]NLL33488.1 bacteriocin [Enterococcus cecorum]
MKSLEEISILGDKLEKEVLENISGGKKVPNYSNTWWYKTLDGIGKVAEAGSDLWHIKFG